MELIPRLGNQCFLQLISLTFNLHIPSTGAPGLTSQGFQQYSLGIVLLPELCSTLPFIFLSRLAEEKILLSSGSVLLSSAVPGSFGSFCCLILRFCLTFLEDVVAFLQVLFKLSAACLTLDQG